MSMTREELFSLHEETCKKCLAIMIKKNHDYTGGDDSRPFANFKDSEVFGIPGELGILLRVLDKMKRLQAFVSTGELHVDDEGWEDACDDIVNYMILLKGMLTEKADAAGNTL